MKKFLILTAMILKNNIALAAGTSGLENATNNFVGFLLDYICPVISLAIIAWSLVQLYSSNGTSGFKNFCGNLIVAGIIAYLEEILSWLFGWSFSL